MVKKLLYAKKHSNTPSGPLTRSKTINRKVFSWLATRARESPALLKVRMFESVVATVLNNVLGKYVSNLEQNQLNVGIFSGNVVLHGLKLKKEALEALNLPIDVLE